MALPGAYAQYNNSKVLTASPAELTLMLYDGAIKFCNIAEMAVEKSDVPKAHENIRKVQNYHFVREPGQEAGSITENPGI